MQIINLFVKLKRKLGYYKISIKNKKLKLDLKSDKVFN